MSPHRWPSLLLVTALLVFPSVADPQAASQEWHPMLEELWADSDRWELLGPDQLQVAPERLAGLRVAYLREENLLETPRREHAAFQYDRGWVDGEQVLIARFFASGDPEIPGSTPTRWSMTVDPTSFVPSERMVSAGWGAMAMRETPAGLATWQLRRDETAWSEAQIRDGSEPLLDLSMWGQILAALPLRAGMKFRTQSSPSWIGPAFHVAARATFADLDGREHPVWVVETAMGRSGWVGLTFVSTEEPLFVGFERRHIETGVVDLRWRLKGYTRLSSAHGPSAPQLPSVFDDQDTWPITAPGDVDFDARRLIGLRLVHQRTWGLENPDVQDVVYQFEQVAWRGRPALMMLWHRSGDTRFEHRSAFLISSISDLETLRVWDETNSNQGSVTKTFIESEAATSVTRTGDDEPVIVRRPVSLAAFSQQMPYVLIGLIGDLEVGQKYRLPTVDPRTLEVVDNAYHIAREVTIEDVAGRPVRAFDAQVVLGRDPAFLGHFYITEEAPFFVAFELERLGVGVIGRHDLKEFEYR